MGIFKTKQKTPGFIEQLVLDKSVLPVQDKTAGLRFLILLFDEIRPSNKPDKKLAEKNLLNLIEEMRQNNIAVDNTRNAFLSQLINTDLTGAITQSGIPLARGFWQELLNRLKHKMLPRLQDEHDFLYVINSIFSLKSDYKWVETIPRQAWINFFTSVGFRFSPQLITLKNELLQALKILSFQVAQLGLEKDILDYLPAEEQYHDAPFVKQNYKAHEVEKLLLDNAAADEIKSVTIELKNLLMDCYDLIDHIRDSHSEKGASIQQTYLLLILSNRLQRMQLVIDILDADNEFDTGRFVDIFRMLVRNEKRKNSIREFLSQGIGYLAYQIAEHKGSKGNRYITTTTREYYSMMYSAMKGGLIISFVAIFKNLLGKL